VAPSVSEDLAGVTDPLPVDPLPLRIDETVTGRLVRVPPSLDPTILPEPEPHDRLLIGTILIGGGVIVSAAMLALVVVKLLPAAQPRVAEPNASSFSSRYSESSAQRASRPPAAMPQLTVAPAQPGQNEDPLPLGVAISGGGSGTSVVISGLVPGTTLSNGRSGGADSWRLAADELSGTAIRPPRGFAGSMEVLAELRLPDGTVVERRPLHFERVAPSPPPRPALRQLDADEIASLLKRGEDYIATGDLASARLVLQRGAEAGDARAALALAGTYDPNVLEQLGFKGFAPDVGMALAWYEKARDFGSPEAPRRLERLASRDR
jgi:hypothetical protein